MNIKDPKAVRVILDFVKVILGLLVALAWNEPVQYFATTFLPESAAFFVLLLFAVLMTGIAIVVILKMVDLESRQEGQTSEKQVGSSSEGENQA